MDKGNVPLSGPSSTPVCIAQIRDVWTSSKVHAATFSGLTISGGASRTHCRSRQFWHRNHWPTHDARHGSRHSQNLGATRRHIIGQTILESLILCFIAMGLALSANELLLPHFASLFPYFLTISLSFRGT